MVSYTQITMHMRYSKPKVSIISPTIRMEGLIPLQKSLEEQTFKEFEWLPRPSLTRFGSDLNYQMNQAIMEAKGELLVFYQDWMMIHPKAIESIWTLYKENIKKGWTFPVGKVVEKYIEGGEVTWDWRHAGEDRRETKPWNWEMDFACLPRQDVIDVGAFEEDMDGTGIGWENCVIAYKLFKKKGFTFHVKQGEEFQGYVWDHDAHEEHPYKGPEVQKWNQSYWNDLRGKIDRGVA